MNFKIIFYVVGYVLKIEGLLMYAPALVGFLYREQQAWSYLIVATACLIFGLLATLKKPKNQMFYAKEGFISVALSWIVLSLFGCIPFMLSGDIPRFTDAFFEMVSGFTTTGASILTGEQLDALGRCSIFWRSFSHWIGGMGILVFILSILPITGGATMHLMRAESPGPQVGKIVPKIRDTSTILYVIYTAMTAVEIVILLLGGMPLFDAVTVSFGTAGTGGFSVRSSGMADYSVFCQYVIAVFMILFGVNFNVYFLMIRKHFKQAMRCEEARWYVGIIAVSTALITVNTLHLFDTVEETFRHALFQVGSIITTTGYTTTDFNLFPEFAKGLLVLLMFCGACAGSTGGGIKVSRFVIIGKAVLNEIHQILHPRSVKKVRLEGKAVDTVTTRSVLIYFATFFLLFSASVLIVSLDRFDGITNFTAVAATINNIGPGLGAVGPTGTFGGFNDLSKLVMSFDMLAGRLELFPILILLSPESWKRPFQRKK